MTINRTLPDGNHIYMRADSSVVLPPSVTRVHQTGHDIHVQHASVATGRAFIVIFISAVYYVRSKGLWAMHLFIHSRLDTGSQKL